MFKPKGDALFPHNPQGVYGHGLEDHRADPNYVGPEAPTPEVSAKINYEQALAQLAAAGELDKKNEENREAAQMVANIGNSLANKQSFGNFLLGKMNPRTQRKRVSALPSERERLMKGLAAKRTLQNMQTEDNLADPNSAESRNEAEALRMMMPGLADRVQPGKMSANSLNKYKGLAANDYSREDAQKHGHTMFHHNSELRKYLQDRRLADSAKNRRAARGSDNFKREKELRAEVRNLSKDSDDVSVAYEKILNAAKQPSGPADLSMIFAYMKMLDPGSTVREGEFATAEQAGSVPERLRVQYNKALNGEKLSPKMRSQFLSEAKGVYRSQMEQQRRVNDRYQTLSGKYGLDSKNVVSPEMHLVDDEASFKPEAQAKPDSKRISEAKAWLSQNPDHPQADKVKKIISGGN